MKKILLLIFATVAIIACNNRPKNILSAGKMEDVLYDYHIAQAMIDELGYEDREKMAQAYIDAVFEKYNITEAQFDSSLVYYNRNAEELNKIYQNLKTRFDDENQQLALSTGNDVMAVYSQNGDTANIWNGSKVAVLRSKEGLNYESFTIKADSSFHRKDKFLLVCNVNIISENDNNQDNYINMGLTITYKDGTNSATSTMRRNSSPNVQLTLSAFEDKDITSVSGYFYYNGNKDLRNIGFVSNIGLVRMRTVKEEPKPEKEDSVKIDTIPSIRHAHEHGHNSQDQSQKIEIKVAPDVRTPNSTFTRRRTIRR